MVNPKEEFDDLCLSTHTESRSDSWFMDSYASFHELLVENGSMIISKVILDI